MTLTLADLTIPKLQEAMNRVGYIASQETVVTLYLALRLGKPLLLEGPPGVGKTEIAKVLSEVFGAELIRLQCYEGLDETKALYEWNYQRQLIRIQLAKAVEGQTITEEDIFSEEYLLERPLLRAIRQQGPAVLLIDEVDKTDEEFEAFLFELLSEFQVTVPELGTIKATHIPMVVLTSNGERELSDGLKRRCLYLYLDYPDVATEIRIIQARVPGVGERLTREVARVVAHLRQHLDLNKKPSIAETLDWVRALIALNADRLTPELIQHTLNVILKHKDDINTVLEFLGTEGLFRVAQEEKGR
ncbi:MAG: hypothetical protein PWQ91_391 [Eubacteriales bacterium]|nr:hypothetical protein [Eubacteriales bacterium]MDN5363330.1 hypothetical protein [Eubacteriales bacterium]